MKFEKSAYYLIRNTLTLFREEIENYYKLSDEYKWISDIINLLDVKQEELLKIRIEEQLKESEEEAKRYYLKHNFLTGLEFSPYLNFNTENGEFFLGSKTEAGAIKTKFTEEEIDDLEQDLVFSVDDFTKEVAY